MSDTAPSLRECFDRLVDLSPAQRDAWLAAHALDPALRHELTAMLASDARDVPLLDAPAAALVRQYTPHDDEGHGLVGSRIGPYRLVDVLGHGGTSVVFRAQRASGTGTQTVALKLLRTGLFSADGQRRFRREQGVLAQLSHRHIASLIEGGISDAGIPYIAMEFVDGLPITRYADVHALDLRARIALLVTVCRAIDAAHRALVVHCDLKPSNVLVDGDGDIKVLDFGIARLLGDDAPGATQTSAIALTPGYAAPEQYLPGMVTTASDIYALGILMGELLTGQLLPAGQTRVNLSRAHLFADRPALPGLPSGAALARVLRGDLDAICNTARAPDPQRRYLSAALLADDLERWLRNEPVVARTPSAWYRLRKAMQRHRAAAGAVAFASLALAVGVSLTVWQAHVAGEQAQRATAVRDFLIELFDASRAGQLPDRRPTLEQLVQRASTRLTTHTDLSPATRIEMLRTLGEVSAGASDYAQADALYSQALALANDADDDPALTQIRLLQARLLILQSRYADASRAYEALLPQMRRGNDAASVEGLQNYASALMYSARTDAALAISAEAARRAAALYAPASKGAVHADLTRANQLIGGGRNADAAPLLEAALKTWRESERAPTDDFLQGLTDLSRVRGAQGRNDEAEALLREAVATAEKMYAGPHDRLALALLNLGDVLRLQDRLDEALPFLTRALAMMRTIYGDDHLRVSNTLASLGELELRRRHFDAAAEHVRSAIRWCERPDLHATRSCIEMYAARAGLALATGDLDTADASSARALAMAQELFRDGNRRTARLWQLRAELLLRRNDAPGALALCDRALALLARLGASDGMVTQAVLARRADALQALGRSAEALADVGQALAMWRRLAPAGTLREVELLGAQASIEASLDDAPAARDTARRALALIGDRTRIEPALLARIDALAKSAR